MTTHYDTCYFCGSLIIGKAERHHVTPKRYFRRGQGNMPANLVMAHSYCHKNFHRWHDNPQWTLREFRLMMRPIEFGRLLFD